MLCLNAAPVKIIFDTDMGNDVDDVMALMMLYSYIQQGKVDLKGVVINKTNQYAPIYTNILNDFYGFYDIPIAHLKSGKASGEGHFLKIICEEKTPDGLYVYPRRSDVNSNFPDAIKFLRKVLAEEKADNDIVIVTVGFSSIMAKFLESTADEISPLSGLELFKKKIKFVSIMSGRFDEPTYSKPLESPVEWNIKGDPISSKTFFELCPVPMIFSGGEVGNAIAYPQTSVDKDFSWSKRNPFVDAYNIFAYHVAKSRYKKLDGRHDRDCYDLTSVLAAVEDPLEYFKLSEKGDVRCLDDKGHTAFTPNPNGRDSFLIVDESKKQKVIEKFIELCTLKPNKNKE